MTQQTKVLLFVDSNTAKISNLAATLSEFDYTVTVREDPQSAYGFVAGTRNCHFYGICVNASLFNPISSLLEYIEKLIQLYRDIQLCVYGEISEQGLKAQLTGRLCVSLLDESNLVKEIQHRFFYAHKEYNPYVNPRDDFILSYPGHHTAEGIAQMMGRNVTDCIVNGSWLDVIKEGKVLILDANDFDDSGNNSIGYILSRSGITSGATTFEYRYKSYYFVILNFRKPTLFAPSWGDCFPICADTTYTVHALSDTKTCN